MKKIITTALAVIVVLITILTVSSVTASAHFITPWENYYTVAKADTTYSFAFNNWNGHVNGSTVNYFFPNSTSESYFGTAVVQRVY